MCKSFWAVLCAGFWLCLYLFQLVIAIFVVPIGGQCDWNSIIPDDSYINLSMSTWIYVNLGVAIFINFVIASLPQSDNGRAVKKLVIVFTIFYIFVFAWSIIGLVIYSDYYREACSELDHYRIILNLGIFTDMITSSTVIIFLLICFCIKLHRYQQAEQERLIDKPPVLPGKPIRSNNFSEKIDQNEDSRSVLTNDELQRQRRLYQTDQQRLIYKPPVLPDLLIRSNNNSEQTEQNENSRSILSESQPVQTDDELLRQRSLFQNILFGLIGRSQSGDIR